jgi:hypothetical protein
MTLRKALMNVDKAEKIGSISVDHWILDISGISGKVLKLGLPKSPELPKIADIRSEASTVRC